MYLILVREVRYSSVYSLHPALAFIVVSVNMKVTPRLSPFDVINIILVAPLG